MFAAMKVPPIWMVLVVGLVACGATTPSPPADRDGGADRSSPDHLPALSCNESGAGTTDCGGDGGCCTSLAVPGGGYDRTYANDGGGPADAGDPASITGFRLDEYLVTVGRFRQFVAASAAGWTPAPGSGKHAHLNGGLGLTAAGSVGYEPGWSADDTVELATTAADGANRLACELSYATWTDAPGANETLPMN